MSVDTKALFRESFSAELEKRVKESPSYGVEDYSVTGKARAPYGKRTLAYWEDNGHTLVDNWVEWRKATRWEIWEPDGEPAIELGIDFILPGDIKVKTFIDRVFVLPTGEPAIVDLKTGRTPETPEQLGLYATAIESRYGVRINWGYWWDAHKGTHIGPYDLSRYTPTFFSLLYKEVAAGINAGCFPPRPANNCKDWCSTARYCAAVGGPDAAGVDPLAS